MSHTNWSELDRRGRRRGIIVAAITVAGAWLLLLGIYYLIPFTDMTSGQAVVRLVLGIFIFIAVFAWQLNRVMSADLPGLRAAQALGGAIPLFLVAFAAGYLSLSHSAASHFSEPLNHTGALYLVVTIFSTVGFGDITPESDLARAIVSIQMILDLVVIGAVVRLLTTAVKGRPGDASVPAERQSPSPQPPPSSGGGAKRGASGASGG